ncbi:caldesmon-like [Procambarus clarkii]|uniref:caldesmon-like n=1 Tax=Procambarus clarkii TaxID=6728 RepID=UPI003742BBE0
MAPFIRLAITSRQTGITSDKPDLATMKLKLELAKLEREQRKEEAAIRKEEQEREAALREREAALRKEEQEREAALKERENAILREPEVHERDKVSPPVLVTIRAQAARPQPADPTATAVRKDSQNLPPKLTILEFPTLDTHLKKSDSPYKMEISDNLYVDNFQGTTNDKSKLVEIYHEANQEDPVDPSHVTRSDLVESYQHLSRVIERWTEVWTREYLTALQEYHYGASSPYKKIQLKPGDLVLIDSDGPRSEWPIVTSRRKTTVKEQMMKLRTGKDRYIEDRVVCEELNKRFQEVFTIERKEVTEVGEVAVNQAALEGFEITRDERKKALEETARLDEEKALEEKAIEEKALEETARLDEEKALEEKAIEEKALEEKALLDEEKALEEKALEAFFADVAARAQEIIEL